MAINTLKYVVFWCAVSGLLLGAAALQCFKCGQYNDGVGSITPCRNDNMSKIITCPDRTANYCLKFVGEGTLVRDCVQKCREEDSWDRTFCCQEDGCNSANRFENVPVLLVTVICTGISMLRLVFNRIH